MSAALLLLTGTASAAASAQWRADSLDNTAAQPGDLFSYEVQFSNVGDEDATAPLAVTGILPAGLTVAEPEKATLRNPSAGEIAPCTQSDGVTPLAGVRLKFAAKPLNPCPMQSTAGAPAT